MSGLTLDVRVEKLRLAAPFRISGFVFEEQDVVVVELKDGQHRGRGEASGVYYLDDKIEKILPAIESRRTAIESGLDRSSLQKLLPPGGARNAVDCAMWELEASRKGVPVGKLAASARCIAWLPPSPWEPTSLKKWLRVPSGTITHAVSS